MNNKFFKVCAIVFLLLVAAISCSNLDYSGKVKDLNTATKEVVNTAIPEPTKVDDIELGAGNYTSGIDFPAGVYNITAIESKGVVNSNNIFAGGVSSMMGVAGSGELYQPVVKNIKLPEKMELTITGTLKVRLTYVRSK